MLYSMLTPEGQSHPQCCCACEVVLKEACDARSMPVAVIGGGRWSQHNAQLMAVLH